MSEEVIIHSDEDAPPASDAETCPFILAAIQKIASNEADAARILEDPTLTEVKKVWNEITGETSYSVRGKRWGGRLFKDFYNEKLKT